MRVVVWSTGGVGSIAIRAIQHRRDMELAGVWVHDRRKIGRDAGELAGIGPIGVAATDDADQLIGLDPDCVVYAASGPERDAAAVPDYMKLLSAGINVVTTTSTRLVYPPAFDPAWREPLEEAAAAGGASLYASGIFPGLVTDQLALVLSTLSGSIRTLRVWEVSLNNHYPVASVMMDGMGFGRPLDFEPHLARPGFIEAAWRAPVELLASALGIELDEIQGRLDRAETDREIEVAFGTIPAGTCGAVRTTAIGMLDGREAIVIEHVIRMARGVAPEWPSSDHDASYAVTIEGDPDIEVRLTLGPPDGRGAGAAAMAATAMHVVNAIPYVVAAAPGLVSALDLPVTVPTEPFH